MTPRDHVDLTMPLPPVEDTHGARHAHRRPSPGWGIAAMAMVTVPLGLGLGWFGPDLLGGGPSSDPHSRYEPDIPRYSTATPTPRRAPASGQRLPALPAAPRSTPGPATSHRHTATKTNHPTNSAPPTLSPLVTPPTTTEPPTVSPTATTTGVFLLPAPPQQITGRLTYPGVTR